MTVLFILKPIICPITAKVRKIGINIKPIFKYILMKATIGIGACIQRNHPRENFLNLLLRYPKGMFSINVAIDIEIIACKCSIISL